MSTEYPIVNKITNSNDGSSGVVETCYDRENGIMIPTIIANNTIVYRNIPRDVCKEMIMDLLPEITRDK